MSYTTGRPNNFSRVFRQYSVLGLIRLARDLVFTKILFPDARMVRSPNYIKGKTRISIGKGFTSGVGLRLDCEQFDEKSEPKLIIGNHVEMNDYVHIGCVHSVIIEDNVLIASKVFITDHNHGIYSGEATHSSPNDPPKSRVVTGKPVHIEQNVWLGEMVTVLPGVRIGKGSIIGSNSVVSRDIPSFSVAVGTPAKVVKKFNFDSNRWEKYINQL